MDGSVRLAAALFSLLFLVYFCKADLSPCKFGSEVTVPKDKVNFKAEPGRCTWYKQCAFNSLTQGAYNCYYNGLAKEPSEDKELWSLINSTCPQYSNTKVCCDVEQMKTLADQTQVARSLFARCPACFTNFMKHFCATTCSPDMSTFIEPVDSSDGTSKVEQCQLASNNETVTYLKSVIVYYNKDYGDRLFNSCSNVAYPEQSGKVMDLLCGSKNCNASKWLAFLGDPALDYNKAPFLMKYDSTSHIARPNMTSLNLTLHNCYDEGYKCSCTDCPVLCPLPPIPTVSLAKKRWCSIAIAAVGLVVSLLVSASCWLHAIITWKKNDDDIPSSTTSSLSINADEAHTVRTQPTSIPVLGIFDSIGAWFEYYIKSVFYRWGVSASKYWFIVLPACLLVGGALTAGMVFFNVTTDPVKLWSAPNSQARLEKNYFDENFSPFYRTEQIIVTVKNGFGYNLSVSGTDQVLNFGPAFDQNVLYEAFRLQKSVEELEALHFFKNGSNVTVRLTDICFSPLSPNNTACTIESVFNYFQSNMTRFNYSEGFLSSVTYNASYHINYCAQNPTATLDTQYTDPDHQIPCLGAYGGPIDPNTALGGFNNTDYISANTLLMTFVVKNHVNEADNELAEAWEKVYLDFLKNYTGRYIHISYTAERAITDEINRESRTDVITIAISYLVMFIYIAVFLGHIRSLRTLLIDLKIVLGLFGVVIVLLAVFCSIGLLSYMRVEASLIILEVVPFLVLAVGVDNLFILVHSYEREHRKASNLPVEVIVGRALAEVAPSLLLTSTSESAAFLLGAISSMPAVRSFSLYAGTAVFINFLFQITAFVSVMALDARRQSSFRMDVLCCVRMNKSELPDVRHKDSLLLMFMKKIWTKHVVLHPLMRPFWMLVFGLTFFASLAAIRWTEIGLDQRLALPKDSYLQSYFSDMNAYLHVGPPVYFVIRDGYDYSSMEKQNLICSGSDCDVTSLGTQITLASRISEYTKIAETPSIWLDAYFEWLDPTSTCCGHAPGDPSEPCDDPSDESNSTCVHCQPPGQNKNNRPNSTVFMANLKHFLTANPTTDCAAAGHAAYNSAVVVDYDKMKIGATYAMTFHTILRDSSDFIDALKHARTLSANLTLELGHPVFPYSVFYVYYDQYLHIVTDMALNIGISIAAVFLVTVIMLGMNIWAAVIIISVVFMILTHMGGVMSFANINANAVSLVNLVMTVGIAVEFCSHIVRWFMSAKGNRLERAHSALAHMGSSVVSGITCTKFLGVFILFFAKSQLFEVYYFRMYISMVCIGAAHGLIFLPVLLSYIGPPVQTVRTKRPYPKDPSERHSAANSPTAPYIPVEDDDEDDKYIEDKKEEKLYPQLPTTSAANVNDIAPYGGYGAPTYPKGEKTPLLS